MPPGDLEQVFNRALTSGIADREKEKFANVEKPRRPRVLKRARTIPAHVRLAVYKRDGGRCTFVGENGRRCEATTPLEFDHILPVAQGGNSTLANVRLLCRAHNQFAAEQAFGEAFMERKRVESELRLDVAAGLRSLGMRAGEARSAAEKLPIREDMTVEEALRETLRMLRPKRENPPARSPVRKEEPEPVAT